MFDFADTSFAFLYTVDKKSLAPFQRPVNHLENNDFRLFPSSKTLTFKTRLNEKEEFYLHEY